MQTEQYKQVHEFTPTEEAVAAEQQDRFVAINLEPMLEQVTGREEETFPGAVCEDTVRAEIAALYGPVPISETGFFPGITDKRAATEATITTTVAPVRVQNPERTREPKFTTRSAVQEDLDALVDLDMEAFKAVYSEYGKPEAEMRAELYEKFAQRFAKIDLGWVRVAEMDGEVCGFMMACPTSKSPEDFVSWEDTTDDGTLETTYDPNGENIYIVSLTMPRPECGDSPKNMLFVDLIGKAIQEGYKRGYFESRLPGLRNWVLEECEKRSVDFGSLSKEEITGFAQEYVTSTVTKNGKEVLRDPHLRMYNAIGCKFEGVVPDAYQDAPSLDHGVVAVYEVPVPGVVMKSKIARRVIGGAVRMAGRSHAITKKFFS